MSQEYKQDLSDSAICNQSGNVPLYKVLEACLSRRDILKGGLAGAATTFFAAASMRLVCQVRIVEPVRSRSRCCLDAMFCDE